MNFGQMIGRLGRGLGSLILLLGLCGTARADEKNDFFEARIRPLLAKHCLECHGDEGPEAGLRLTSRAQLLTPAE